MSSDDDTPRTRTAAQDVSENAVTRGDQVQTARWTRFLPETFGIRKSVEASKYRWCARESAMWGIATGTAMTLHRFRMQSPTTRAVNVGFATVFAVFTGSYYFCVKRRDYQEQMIELMMRLNTFEHAQNMPEERPIDETHPFVQPATVDDADAVPNKQYVANLPERKEWQPQLPTQDAANVFQPHEPNDEK